MAASARNYLLPIDMPSLASNAALNPDLVLQSKAISETTLLDAMGAASYQLLILDACRDNASGTKTGNKGLERRSNVGAGSTDCLCHGGKQNCKGRRRQQTVPYAQSLAKHFGDRRLSIVQALDATAAEVKNATESAQSPMKSGDLAWNVYFALTPSPAAQPSPPSVTESPRINPEEEAWKLAKNANSEGAYRGFLLEYPAGPFSASARLRMEETTRRRPAPTNGIPSSTIKSMGVHKRVSSTPYANANTMAISSQGYVAMTVRPASSSSTIQSEVTIVDRTDKLVTTLVGPGNSIVRLSFSSDGSRLLGQQYGSDCFVWSIPGGTLIKRIEGGTGCQWANEGKHSADARKVVWRPAGF